MSCPGFNEDPPCKTFRKLSQKQQQKQAAPQPTGEDCPQCGKPLVLRQGSYGEFVSCSGYPKCKYVKQNIIEGLKCPKCGVGDLAERKARARQHLLGLHELSEVRFYVESEAGGGEVPGVRQLVPGGEDAALGDLSGMSEQEEGRRGRGCAEEAGGQGSAAPAEGAVVCHYSKRIGNAPPLPTAETHGPVVEKAETATAKKGGRKKLQRA